MDLYRTGLREDRDCSSKKLKKVHEKKKEKKKAEATSIYGVIFNFSYFPYSVILCVMQNAFQPPSAFYDKRPDGIEG